MEDLLRIHNLKLSVDGDEIININDFRLSRGQYVFILGKNGSGKSTILKKLFSPDKNDDYATLNYQDEAIATLNENSSMPVNLIQKEVHNDLYSYKSFVYIGQEETYVSPDSVLDSIVIPTKIALKHVQHIHRSKIDFEEKAIELAMIYLKDIYSYDHHYRIAKKNNSSPQELEKIALKILRKKRTAECSGGQKKMISLLSGILRAEALEVDLIVMDEPLNHLDQSNKRMINKLLLELLEKFIDLSILICSHLLVFDFIKDPRCHQYKIMDFELVKMEKKVYHDGILDDVF